MKNKVVKIIFRTTMCVTIFVMCWLYVGFVLTPKNYDDIGGDYYFAYKSIFNEEPNTIDVMFSGNSNTFKSCIPMEFYEQTGATCYNIGGSIQSAQAMEARIKSVLKCQSPKLIIFDVDCLYDANVFFTGSNKYRLLPIIAPVLYHNRWAELKFSDFYKKPYDDKNFMKGYVALHDVYGYQLDENYMKDTTTEIEPLDASVLKNMKNIQKICEENNIKMLFVSVPSPATWTNQKHNGIEQLADEMGISYLDLNMPDVDFGFDYSLHIADEGYHCNFEGSRLVTKYICDYVNENYVFEDRRVDPKYSKWVEQAEQYNEYVSSF